MATASNINIDTDACVVCGKETTKICSKCKGVSYCGKECQQSDKKSHEPTCELVLDNVPWCDVCNASQDLRVVCFQCGFVFCGPCFERATRKKGGLCPGCSRPIAKSTVRNEKNVLVLKDLVEKETNTLDYRRVIWCFVLGQIFLELLPKNLTLAKHYFNLSGSLGYGEGYKRLGELYMEEGDWRRAKEAFEEGTAFQCVGAMRTLGTYYRTGAFGGNIDYRLAKKWYKEGARLGDEACIYHLGVMYHCGVGTTAVNYVKAVAYFRRAADKGDTDSQFYLGACYFEGKGVAQSYAQARYWWESAAAQQNETASHCLKELSRRGL